MPQTTASRCGVERTERQILTWTLRRLEDNGPVRRTVYAEAPPRGAHELTPLGHRTSVCSGSPKGVPEQTGSSVPDCFRGYRARVRWLVSSRVKRAGSGRSPPSASSALP
ncbi:winged helix-turn-helix transcriptional regulator [Streptomyces goshikiensis]|uniref:winged helix-turn-helix transcriptional regulator n=1 Tax=Streptomyces goshikiensis TaxID=1942 RepID=UPI0036B45BF3